MHDKQFSNVPVQFKSQFIIYTNALQNEKKVRDLVLESSIKMASRSLFLRPLTSRIKGDHAIDLVSRLVITCSARLSQTKHSDNTIVVKSGKNDIVDHVPETLAKNYSTL